MFNDWKAEKAIAALIEEAQDLADRLASAKPHVVEARAAGAWFWAAVYRAEGQELCAMTTWKPAELKRFTSACQTRIAALRKARSYEQSDGLAPWLHTARALAEPRIAPPVTEIWQMLDAVGPNADGMAEDMLQDAGLPAQPRSRPQGFAVNI
jgi:hypothetical protein